MDLYSLDPEIFFRQLKKILADNERLRQDILSYETRLAYWMNRASDLNEELIELKSQPIANNSEPVALKDHHIGQLINQLRDIAIEFHGTQQLRERIAEIIRPLFKVTPNKAEGEKL